MKYKTIITILIFILLFGTIINADAKFQWTFDEALDRAIKSSLELRAKDRAIGKAYDTFEKLENASPLSIEHKNSDFRKFITGQVEPYTKAEDAYYKYRQAILDRDNYKITIANNLRTAIVAVNKAEKAAKEAEESKKAWENELKLLNIRFDKNLMVKTEYTNNKKELEKKIKDTEKTKKSLDDAYYNLNTILDRENEPDIEITMDITLIPLEKLDLEQIEQDNLMNDINVIQKKNSRYVQKLYYELVDEESSEYNFNRLNEKIKDYILEVYDEAKDSYESADIEYEKALLTFNKDFEETIENIIDSFEQLSEIEEQIREAQQSVDIHRIKYNARLVSKAEYDSKVLSLATVKGNFETQQMDLYQKLIKLLAYSDMKKVIKK